MKPDSNYSWRVGFLIFFLTAINSLLAQTDSLTTALAEFAEQETDLAEHIQLLRENPVNINTADRQDLLAIPFFTADVADSILQRRNRVGEFTTMRQLRPLLGNELYALIKDLITIKYSPRKRLTISHKNYYPIDKPAEMHSYAGDVLYDYTRITWQFQKQIKAGLITQKDLGEQSYLDYVHGFAEFRYGEWQIILGSYALQAGSGLSFSRGLFSQKSALPALSFRTPETGGYATLSSAENSGQSGIFIQTPSLSQFKFAAFYANNLRDAQLSVPNGRIIGLDFDGYHRTVSERNKRDLIREQLWGVTVVRDLFGCGQMGALLAKIKYNPELAFRQSNVGSSAWRRQRFKFAGKNLTQYSLFYRLYSSVFRLSGEWAVSDRGSPGLSQSAFLDLKKIQTGIQFWRISPDFQSPNGRMFDDSNPFPQAQQGIYAALLILPGDDFRFSAYKLLKKDLWRSYFSTLPQTKDEWLLQGDYFFEKNSASVRFRHKADEQFSPSPQGGSERKIIGQSVLRLELTLHPAKAIRLKSRLEHTRLDVYQEHGTYIFQDIHFDWPSNLSLATRVTFFRSDSYNSRMYEYEADLPGSFANYALYGEGFKWYLMLCYDFSRYLTCWLKWRHLYTSDNYLLDRHSTGGRDEIQRDVRLQIQINL